MSDNSYDYSDSSSEDVTLSKPQESKFMVQPVPLRPTKKSYDQPLKLIDDNDFCIVLTNDERPYNGYVIIDLRKDYSPLSIKNIRHTINDEIFCAPNFRLFWLASLCDENRYTEHVKEVYEKRKPKATQKATQKTTQKATQKAKSSVLSKELSLRETYIKAYKQIINKRFEKKLIILKYLVRNNNKIVFISNRFKEIKFDDKKLFKQYIDEKINKVKIIKEPVYYEYLIIDMIITQST